MTCLKGEGFILGVFLFVPFFVFSVLPVAAAVVRSSVGVTDVDAVFSGCGCIVNPLEFAAMETVRSTAVAYRFGNRNNFDYPGLDLGSIASHNN